MNLIDKKQVHRECLDYLGQKVRNLQLELNALQESVLAESKSSAGDKHETSREMIAQEQNRVGKQLEEMQNQLKLLEKIPLEAPDAIIRRGSLVETNSGLYYLSVGIGKLMVNGITVYCISLDSPVCKLMLGKKVLDTFNVNTKKNEVLSVF
jgi:transcription elongation GreA/GreB family factor